MGQLIINFRKDEKQSGMPPLRREKEPEPDKPAKPVVKLDAKDDYSISKSGTRQVCTQNGEDTNPYC